MPAPLVATYTVLAKREAHIALRNKLDGVAGGAFIRILNAAGDALADVPLTYPCGTVSTLTGALTLTPAGPDPSAETGTAAYAEVMTISGELLLSVPVVQGSSSIAGFMTLNTLAIVGGAPFEITAAVIE